MRTNDDVFEDKYVALRTTTALGGPFVEAEVTTRNARSVTVRPVNADGTRGDRIRVENWRITKLSSLNDLMSRESLLLSNPGIAQTTKTASARLGHTEQHDVEFWATVTDLDAALAEGDEFTVMVNHPVKHVHDLPVLAPGVFDRALKLAGLSEAVLKAPFVRYGDETYLSYAAMQLLSKQVAPELWRARERVSRARTALAAAEREHMKQQLLVQIGKE